MTPELLEAGAAARSRALTRVVNESGPVFNQGVALYVEDLRVAFDGFQALGGLSFTVGVGELRCVIGPNGAGKTTTMDCITGKTKPDSGRIFFGSNLDLRTMNEQQIARAGIGRKFQKPTVFEALTVSENLELALAGDRRARFAMRARLSGEQRDRLGELLKTVHLAEEHDRFAGLLSHGQKQWLEIGMLLAQDPKLLLLDEPVAGMTDEETERTAELFLSLEGQHSLVVVEHDMSFVATLAATHRTVTVLHEGQTLAEGTMAQVQSDEKVIEVYLGR
ncbi:MAG TPA: urea ABC transporter ATP-binding protein UrtD [Roseateles sp.]|uniref:urea ABC transporter ATP-binding protein UrtD n=1 Tax=Roseateles sp. TaxID=1971397 RepID=UPI002ED8F0A5